MKIFKILILITLVFQLSFGKNTKTLNLFFLPIYNSEALILNNQYFNNTLNNYFSVSIFKFYVSNFQFYDNQKLVYISTKNGFLIDLSNKDSLNQKLEIPINCNFNKIKFCFGIDDKTNNEGISDGDLDPSMGMYWTWQTGYINMKLEGNYDKNKSFQFHLGGFLLPFISFQNIDLQYITDINQVKIIVNFNRLLEKIDLIETNTIMSPSKKSVELSKIVATMFSL